MKSGGFFKSNWSYLIWFIFYFAISFLIVNIFTTAIWESLLITGILYIISISFSLSPMGEAIIRNSTGANSIKTNADSEYLLPLFDDVYKSSVEIKTGSNRSIKLYIINSYEVNAFAVGRNTIAVTRGAIEGFSENELQGVLAHEFGHIAYGDTKALVLTRVGNGFFSLVIGIINLFIKIFHHFIKRKENNDYIILLLKIITCILNFIIGLFLGIGDIILCLNSRYSEYLADGFAYRSGYGQDLVSALYILDRLSPEQRPKFRDRLKASHPFTADRIARLESLE